MCLQSLLWTTEGIKHLIRDQHFTEFKSSIKSESNFIRAQLMTTAHILLAEKDASVLVAA